MLLVGHVLVDLHYVSTTRVIDDIQQTTEKFLPDHLYYTCIAASTQHISTTKYISFYSAFHGDQSKDIFEAPLGGWGGNFEFMPLISCIVFDASRSMTSIVLGSNICVCFSGKWSGGNFSVVCWISSMDEGVYRISLNAPVLRQPNAPSPAGRVPVDQRSAGSTTFENIHSFL